MSFGTGLQIVGLIFNSVGAITLAVIAFQSDKYLASLATNAPAAAQRGKMPTQLPVDAHTRLATEHLRRILLGLLLVSIGLILQTIGLILG
jgi:hypothetical protein